MTVINSASVKPLHARDPTQRVCGWVTRSMRRAPIKSNAGPDCSYVRRLSIPFARRMGVNRWVQFLQNKFSRFVDSQEGRQTFRQTDCFGISDI